MTQTTLADDRAAPGAPPAEDPEPETTGTLFLMVIFLMLIAGVWVLVYRLLLER